jgi:uncharacterized YigZ family protein
MTPDFYNTIEKSSTAEFKDRGSRFIAFAYPIRDVNDFKEKLESVKKQHPKATHHCFAYRLGPGRSNYRVSDDGEPSGTAGKPILGQIDSNQLTDILVIVVRYFGGTLLGVGGLISAYKTAASLALQATQLIQKPVCVRYLLQFDYTLMNDIMTVCKQNDCAIVEREMGLYCSLVLDIPKNRVDAVLQKFSNLKGLEFSKIHQ